MKNDLQMSLLPKEETTASWFQIAQEALDFTEDAGWPDKFGDALSRSISSYKERPIRTLSLFSGGGGLDIGFHDAGFQIVECVELERDFCATLKLNATEEKGRLFGSSIICADIKNYSPNFSDIDFIIGGPPCQTFSAAGARAAGVNGTDDDRGNLFLQYARLIHKLRPVGFFFENVYRIVGAQKGAAWAAIQKSFSDLGYRLYWRILDAADYGAPQFRERLIVIGLREGTFQFPRPSHGPDSMDLRPFYTSGLAVSGLADLGDSPRKIGGRHGHLLDDIPPGLNYSFYTQRMNHPTPIFAWRSKFSDYLYKADPSSPVRTVKAQGGQYTGPFSWHNRPFSTNEFKRLQTFPDDYKIFGNRQKIIHQLGNSVPPQLARVLALSIRSQLFGQRVPFQIETLAHDEKLGFRTRKNELTRVYARKAGEAIAARKTSVVTEKSSSFRFLGGITVAKNLSAELIHDPEGQFAVSADLGEDQWIVSLRPRVKSTKSLKFTYEIKLYDEVLTNIASRRIVLKSFSSDPWAIVSIWKALEKVISNAGIKDDLIQLFGYYQYKRRYELYFESESKTLGLDTFWSFLKKISESDLIGKIVPVESFCQSFDMDEQEIVGMLRRLKELGFEVRNCNTNKQIRPGNFLVPYPFPTLNDRSLQRFSSL